MKRTFGILAVGVLMTGWVLALNRHPSEAQSSVVIGSGSFATETGGTVIMDIPKLCRVRTCGSNWDASSSRLVISATKGTVVEYSVLDGSTYKQGEVASGYELIIGVPRYRTFTLTVSRPLVGKIGWLHGRVNDWTLAAVWMYN